MDDERREEYDIYLASLGLNRKKEKESNLTQEEIERRRKERGK